MKITIALITLTAWVAVAFTGSIAALLLLAPPVAVAIGSACRTTGETKQ